MNKNKRNIAYILLTIVALSSFSCTKDFTKINVDPLGKTEIAPDKMLAPTLVNLMRTNMLRNRNFNNELMQVTVDRNDGEGRVFRYDIRTTQADNTWNNWYVNLTDIKDIYTVAQKPEYANKSYQAISLIVQAWVYQLITDTYGDVPYKEANNGRESLQPSDNREQFIQPVFDKQKDIYLDLFSKLEEANELLKGNVAITAESDPVYNGNVAKWRKLGNSLYLRLLMRVAHKSDVSANVIGKMKEIIDLNPTNYPVMTNNHFSNQVVGGRYFNDSDNGVILWNGTNAAAAVYTSPYMSNIRANDFRNVGLAEFFMNNMIDWKHPSYLNMGAPSY
ncbi:MAG: SusD/RagB family nutrient-binding outer membrane lipoprotein, partial [Flavobacterium sp.]